MKRKPILLKSIYGLGEQSEKKTIGLVGTHQGVGVTHTGLMLSNYLGKTLGKRTAFLERNTHSDFRRIEEAYYGKEEAVSKSFRISKVSYYKEVTRKETTDILNEEYEYIIFDFGTDLGSDWDDFLRCDRKIVVSSLSDWKRQALYQFYQRNNETKGYNSWIHLFVFGQKRDLLDLKADMKIKARLIGYEPIIEKLSKETIGLFHSII